MTGTHDSVPPIECAATAYAVQRAMIAQVTASTPAVYPCIATVTQGYTDSIDGERR